MQKEKDVLVKVEGLGKKFSKDLKKSLVYGLVDVCKSVVGLGSRARSTLRKDEFWAVRNVSFELRRGEVLGLIGHNGAGKSTLLKMLNGLIRPDEGSITMHGRVGALIELGTGFNPILTGRENIYVNGQILGFSKSEIDTKLESIIEFSEIREFIDSPVQNYSSGMKVRLGFAVAAQMEPDVLIVDEVLAVGDVGFRGKCLKVISEMMSRAAVIFVSHSMPIVNRYCSRGILMEKGNVVIDSMQVQDSIDRYLDSFETKNNSSKYSSGQIRLEDFKCDENDMLVTGCKVQLFDDVTFSFRIRRLQENLKVIRVKINAIDQNLVIVAAVFSDILVFDTDVIKFALQIQKVNIKPGTYKLSLIFFAGELTDAIEIHESLYTLEITGEKDYGGNYVILKQRTMLS